MSAVKGWRANRGQVSPNIIPYLVEASQDIRAGDILALKGDTTASRVIKATATELDFQNATPAIAGLLGVAWHSIKTDANGQPIASVPSTVDPGAIVNYPAVSYAGLTDRQPGSLTGTTPDIGSARIAVAIFEPFIEWLMDACGAANAATIVSAALEGKSAGLQAVGADVKVDVSVATGSASGLVITDVSEREPNYNLSANVNNGVWFRVRTTHSQLNTGLMYP